MPYVNIKVTPEGLSPLTKAELIAGVTHLLADVLGKNPQTTVVVIDEVATDNWGIAGETVTVRRRYDNKISGDMIMMRPMQAVITGAEGDETDTPMGALSEFYRAFNNRDLNQMRRNWSADECVLNNPLGGIRRGWSEIEPLYQRLFSGPARVYVEFYDYTTHFGEDIFCVAGRERGSFEKGNVKFALVIRTSRIFRKVDGRWKQIHHHGSIEDTDLLAKYQNAVLAK